MGYRTFSSYNALDRPAMFFGVPFVPAIIAFMILLVIAVIAQKIIGIMGFTFLALGLPVFLFLRFISETDDRATNILLLEMLFRFKRKYYQEFGNTLTYLPMKYLRNGKYIQQILKQANLFNWRITENPLSPSGRRD